MFQARSQQKVGELGINNSQQSIRFVNRPVGFYPHMIFRHPHSSPQARFALIAGFRIDFRHPASVPYTNSMSKLIWVGAILIIVLVVGDVVQVSFDLGKITELPGRLRDVATHPTRSAPARAQLLHLRRSGEQLAIRDEGRKLELAVVYVKTDSERLHQLLKDEATNPSVILTQLELVNKSLIRLEKQLTGASEEARRKVAGALTETLPLVGSVIEKLRVAEERLASQSRIRSLTEGVETKLEAVTEKKEITKEVSSPTPTAAPASTKIPLSF